MCAHSERERERYRYRYRYIEISNGLRPMPPAPPFMKWCWAYGGTDIDTFAWITVQV